MKKRKDLSKLIFFLFFIPFTVFILLQFLAPLALPSDSVKDLSGIVGVSDNGGTIAKMSFPWNFVYNCGDVLCHQRADRSFFINGNQMPFCSRCTAIFLGLAIGVGLMVFYRIELDEKFIFIIILGIVPIGIDGVGQLLGFWESTDLVRFITGAIAGIVCGVSIGIIIDEIKEIRTFKKTKTS